MQEPSLKRGAKIEIVCRNCAKPFSRSVALYTKPKSNIKYCSRKCFYTGRDRSHVTRRMWQGFKSSERQISRAHKPLYGTQCLICGYSRFVEYAHIIPVKNRGTVSLTNIIPLCANHHRLIDRNRLEGSELSSLESAFYTSFCSPSSIDGSLPDYLKSHL